MKDEAQQNLHALAVATELGWLGQVIEARITHFFDNEAAPFVLVPPQDLPAGSALGQLVADMGHDPGARLVLALALAAQVAPSLLDPFFVKNSAIGRGFSQFGGQVSDQQPGFVPTGTTALFLVAGPEPARQIAAMELFSPDHPLRRLAGVSLNDSASGFGARLTIPSHRVMALCEGAPPRPDFSPDFPAERLVTDLDWSDLVLAKETGFQVAFILGWLEHRQAILDGWALRRRFGGGYRALFYGPPGTGKTLTASLIGKRAEVDVYRVDLSKVISKYIGETEKNLVQVFDMAEERDWILFFDEADALFSARGATHSANDRHANQEVSYLLQRIEACQSTVILASNLRSNIDEAFFRRFHLSVGFARPDRAARVQLWQNVLDDLPHGPGVTAEMLAEDYELTGADIVNVARTAAIAAQRRGGKAVEPQDIKLAAATELQKEGRVA